MPLNLTWVDLAFSCTKVYSGQVKRHSLPFQVEAALKYLMVSLTFAHNCTYHSPQDGAVKHTPRHSRLPRPAFARFVSLALKDSDLLANTMFFEPGPTLS